VRWLALVAGTALVVLAFGAATRVMDTREGLVAEVITLLGGLAGVSLLFYAYTAGHQRAIDKPSMAPNPGPEGRQRSIRDLALGAGGVGLAIVLLAGLAVSGGPLWVGLGLALLLPMIAGSVYLCIRFLRSSP